VLDPAAADALLAREMSTAELGIMLIEEEEPG